MRQCRPSPDDTWLGVPFSDADAVEMAEKCGFEPRYRHGAGEQYFWLWFFKRLSGLVRLIDSLALDAQYFLMRSETTLRSASDMLLRPRLEQVGSAAASPGRRCLQILNHFIKTLDVPDTVHLKLPNNPLPIRSYKLTAAIRLPNLLIELEKANKVLAYTRT